jgi:hypothetical protein
MTSLRKTLAVTMFLTCVNASFAASPTFQDRAPGASDVAALVRTPLHYRALSLNFLNMEDALATATVAQPVRIELPTPDGENRVFDVVPVEIMAPELAAKYPRARSYRGVLAQPKNALEAHVAARINTGSGGFSAMLFGVDRVIMIEPSIMGEGSAYISYDRAEVGRASGGFQCGVTDAMPLDLLSAKQRIDPSRTVTGQTLRTYRLALAATGEYTAFFGGTVSGAVQNGIVPAMNRVNEVYQRDFALRMVLVGNNDQIVYTNAATDPYTNSDGFAMLTENQNNLNAVIQSANYDIGHVFSTGGGGVAALRSPCGSGKAQGVTGSSAPTGDPFWIDYVAHEMGHQWGGNHTFNGTTSNCGGGNRAGSAAYEPGSGTTIQAYAGICGAEDLQPNSDPWFHAKSLDEIQNFITGTGNSCASTQPSNNQAPTASAGPAYTIPARTPFILTASGTDPEGGPLLYSFEQYNLGTASNSAVSLATDDGTRPLFRSLNATPNNFRIFPRLSTILGTSAALKGETLPTTSRTLTFRLTVHDQATNGALAIGAIQTSDVNITTVNTGTAFAITSQNSPAVWTGGSAQSITWDVAGTTAAPISCANVQIALSLNQGQSFNTILSASTANDGTEVINVPPATATTARVRVQCVGNIFFDINDAAISIQGDLFQNGFE